jgi:hypothetical protein
VVPVTITHGNLQIHISSCDSPPVLVANQSPAALRSTDGSPSISGASGDAPIDPAAAVWLSRASQNPTNDRAMFRFGLPRAAVVSMRVYDISGRHLAELAGGTLPAGDHTAVWDLRDANGQRVAPGLYFARLAVDGQTMFRTTIAVVK